VSNLRDRGTFETAYAGKAPWDIGKQQGAIAESVHLVTSPVLDAGCGTGENALFLAAGGHQVTGIDFVDEAIRRARRKAAERGLIVEFQVKDAMELGDWDKRFARRNRQRSIPRFLRRGPRSVRRRAYPCHRAGRTAVATMFQRRGARHAGPPAGLAAGDSGRF